MIREDVLVVLNPVPIQAVFQNIRFECHDYMLFVFFSKYHHQAAAIGSSMGTDDSGTAIIHQQLLLVKSVSDR